MFETNLNDFTKVFFAIIAAFEIVVVRTANDRNMCFKTSYNFDQTRMQNVFLVHNVQNKSE